MIEADYSIYIARSGGTFVAGIPELNIAESAASEQEALSAALLKEAEVLHRLADKGIKPPSKRGLIDNAAKLYPLISTCLTFAKKVVAGYLLVVLMTGVFVAIIMPELKPRVMQYVLSNEAAVDTQRLLTRLGIGICTSENK